MKIVPVVALVLVLAGIFGCSKSPVGPTMSSMSSMGAVSTSVTITTTYTTTGGGAGATSVSTTQTNIVSTQTGDTGVAGVNASTGVDSASFGGSSTTQENNGGGSTLRMTLDPTGAATWGAVTVSAGSSPRLTWTVSGVTGITSYEIWVYSLSGFTSVWDVSYTNTSITSVIYGTAPAGSTTTTAPIALSAGVYNVLIHARDSGDYVIGYANGVITVN